MDMLSVVHLVYEMDHSIRYESDKDAGIGVHKTSSHGTSLLFTSKS